MTTAAAHARHLSLTRLEHAAGQAFGCPEDEPAITSRATTLLTPTAITLATFATAVAATITYLV